MALVLDVTLTDVASEARVTDVVVTQAPPLELIPLSELGTNLSDARPTSEMNRQLQQALLVHRAANYVQSRTAFEALLTRNASWTLARFHAACAAAKLNDIAAAAAFIKQVLREDLPEFLPRWEAETDLESLRNSPEGAWIRRSFEALHASWAMASRGTAGASCPAVGSRWRGRRRPLYKPRVRSSRKLEPWFEPVAAPASSRPVFKRDRFRRATRSCVGGSRMLASPRGQFREFCARPRGDSSVV